MPEINNNRFFDEDGMQELSKSSNFNNLRGFYNGVLVTARMNVIRESINYIRRNWNQYEEFMSELVSVLMDAGFDPSNHSSCEESATSLFKKRDWTHVDDYSLIVLYTDPLFYVNVFKIASNIFRDDDSVDSKKLIRSAVFLVELLNIELFNYCNNNPTKSNFSGFVYRGMSVNTSDAENLKNLSNLPLNERYIAIPLALTSASKSEEMSLDFIQKFTKSDAVGVLYRIKVLNLDRKLLKVYNKAFPTSIVSTICAVDVSEISVLPQEQEVLLRGAFLQVLNITSYRKSDDFDMLLIDAVMVNSSRDHIVTAHLGEQDTPARILFGTIVGMTRASYCKDYCKQHNLSSDEKRYADLLTELTAKYKSLTKKKNVAI